MEKDSPKPSTIESSQLLLERQDPSMLKEMIAQNTALEKLVESFGLDINDDDIPF